MTDNTTIALNTTGDTVRDIDRSLNPVPISAKTQVVALDAGGPREEILVSGDDPMPVREPANMLVAKLQYQTLLVAQAGPAGFVPLETPSFLVG